MQLLSQKIYTDITVTDLVKQAQVSRMSFYRNFGSIDNVVESLADDIVKNLNDNLIPTAKENSNRKWRELLFDMIYRFIRIQKDLEFSVSELPRNDVVLMRVQGKIIQEENRLPALTMYEKYAVGGKIYIVTGIIQKWFSTGMQETPEEIVDFIMSIITKF